jgi:aryl-alcohol dehydrogenase-like predicted oxidoreductase
MDDRSGNRPAGGFTRKQFLTLAGGLGAAAALSPLPVLAQSAQPVRRRIPSSGEMLTAVGIGTAIVFVFDPEAEKDKYDARRKVLEAFYAGGGSLIDTSPSYGNAEDVVGKLLADLGSRDKTFLATKIRGRDRAASLREMETSFRKLGTDRIDLMQVHNLINTRENLALIREWKEQGRIRYVGVTHFREAANEELAEVMRTEELDFVQLNYSMAERSAEEMLLPLAADRGMAVLTNLPFGRGKLFAAARGKPLPGIAHEIGAKSWAQFFLKYIISHPAVTAPIPGTDRPEYAIDNLAAASGEMPDAGMRRKMVEAFETL